MKDNTGKTEKVQELTKKLDKQLEKIYDSETKKQFESNVEEMNSILFEEIQKGKSWSEAEIKELEPYFQKLKQAYENFKLALSYEDSQLGDVQNEIVKFKSNIESLKPKKESSLSETLSALSGKSNQYDVFEEALNYKKTQLTHFSTDGEKLMNNTKEFTEALENEILMFTPSEQDAKNIKKYIEGIQVFLEVQMDYAPSDVHDFLKEYYERLDKMSKDMDKYIDDSEAISHLNEQLSQTVEEGLDKHIDEIKNEEHKEKQAQQEEEMAKHDDKVAKQQEKQANQEEKENIIYKKKQEEIGKEADKYIEKLSKLEDEVIDDFDVEIDEVKFQMLKQDLIMIKGFMENNKMNLTKENYKKFEKLQKQVDDTVGMYQAYGDAPSYVKLSLENPKKMIMEQYFHSTDKSIMPLVKSKDFKGQYKELEKLLTEKDFSNELTLEKDINELIDILDETHKFLFIKAQHLQWGKYKKALELKELAKKYEGLMEEPLVQDALTPATYTELKQQLDVRLKKIKNVQISSTPESIQSAKKLTIDKIKDEFTNIQDNSGKYHENPEKWLQVSEDMVSYFKDVEIFSEMGLLTNKDYQLIKTVQNYLENHPDIYQLTGNWTGMDTVLNLKIESIDGLSDTKIAEQQKQSIEFSKKVGEINKSLEDYNGTPTESFELIKKIDEFIKEYTEYVSEEKFDDSTKALIEKSKDTLVKFINDKALPKTDIGKNSLKARIETLNEIKVESFEGSAPQKLTEDIEEIQFDVEEVLSLI